MFPEIDLTDKEENNTNNQTNQLNNINQSNESDKNLDQLNFSKNCIRLSIELIKKFNQRSTNDTSNNDFKEELNLITTILNQIQSNIQNKDTITNLNDVNNKLDKELEFKLNWQLRDKLISVLNNLTGLLYNDKNLNKENLIEKTNNIMHNLLDLPLKLDEDKNDLSIDNNLMKPTLILNTKMKTEIIDLLIKNKNFSTLFKDSIDDNIRFNLINKNNNLVIKLFQSPVQMLKGKL